MDVCSWDWGAIAGFFGAGATLGTAVIALYISNQWRTQKGSEVIANEAQSLLMLINDYENQCIEIHSAILNQRRAILELENLKATTLTIRSKSQFFYELTNSKEDLLLDLKTEITRVYKRLEKFEGAEFRNIVVDNDFPYLLNVMDEMIKQPKHLLMKYFKHEK